MTSFYENQDLYADIPGKFCPQDTSIILLRPLLQTKFNVSDIRIWISDYIPWFSEDLIIHPCPNFKGCLSKLPLKLGMDE